MKRSRGWEDWDYQGFDYGGLKAREINLGVFHIISFMNWKDATGELGADGSKYLVELNMVDVLGVDPRTLVSAIRSCGDDDSSAWSRRDRYMVCAEALHQYGTRGRLCSWEGNSGKGLITKAKRESRRLELDHDALETALDQNANAIGNTQRCFMNGTFGFRSVNADIQRGPRSVLREYVAVLEHNISIKDAEIQSLKQKLNGNTTETHGDQRLVQPCGDVRQ